MTKNRYLNTGLTLLTFLLAFIIFFPILWMVMTSFKTEADAFAYPPQILFQPTLSNWNVALFDTNFFSSLKNTAIITVLSTVLAV